MGAGGTSGAHEVGAEGRAEQRLAADCLQRPLRSRFRQQLKAGVRLQNPADVVVNTMEHTGRFATMEITGTPGEIYEQHVLPATIARWTPDLIAVLDVRPGERVLDVACGTGIVTRLLPDRVGPTGRVVGLDVNGGMLAVARAVTAHASIEWVEGNAMDMPLPDAAFDAVVCQQGLQFVPDKLAALHEMRRVLASGGRLVLSVWRSVAHAPGFRVLEEALARRLGAEQAVLPPFSLGDGQALRALVGRAGFRDVRLRADVKLSRFPSAEHFVRSVVASGPTMVEALAAQGPDVLDALVAEVTDATRDYVDDEGWAAPQVSNIMTAVV
jgi:SAM-dependent methyltransferase